MEREADMFNFAIRFKLFKLRQNIEFCNNIIPRVIIDGMKKIKIYMVGVKLLKLFIENAFNILLAFNIPERKLRCKIYLFTVTVFKSFADKSFAVASVISERSINIINTAVNSAADYSYCLFFINAIILTVNSRQSHATESENGNFNACFTHFSVFHRLFPPIRN